MKSIILSLALISSPAWAQMLSAPNQVTSADRVAVGGNIMNSTIDYDADNDEQEIQRTIFAAELGYGITDSATLFGHLGMITNAEAEGDNDLKVEEGKGMIFGGGVRVAAMQDSQKKVVLFGLMNMTQEEYDDNDVEFQGATYEVKNEVEVTDLIAGATYTYKVNRMFAPYGGLQFVLSSDGEYKAKAEPKQALGLQPVAATTDKGDLERDDSLAFKVGADVFLEGFNLRPEATFAGERNFSLATIYAF